MTMTSDPSKYVIAGDPYDVLADEGKNQVRKWWRDSVEYDPSGEYNVDTLTSDLANALPWTVGLSTNEIVDVVGNDVVRDEDGYVTYFRARPVDLGATFWDGGDYIRPVDYLFDGFVPRGSVGMIVGLPDALKTWIGMGMEAALLRGEPFAGFAYVPYVAPQGSRQTALHVDLEMGTNELTRRAGVVRAKGLGKISYPAIMPNQPEFWTRLERLIRESSDTLLLIDSLSKTNEGIDEKTSGYADAISMSGRFVAADETRTVVWIHHAPKDARSRSLTDLVRGHGAIAGGLDWCYHAERVGDADTTYRARVTCKKMRRGATKPAPFVLQLTDARGIERWEEMRGRGGRARAAAATRSDEDRVLDALRSNADAGRSRDELCRVTGLSRARAVAARQALINTGKVRDVGSYHEPRCVLVESSDPSDQSVQAGPNAVPSDGSRTD